MYDVVAAEIERLHQHALICLSCSTCEASVAFWALKALAAHHNRGHLCVDDDGYRIRMYGQGLPFGPDCPGLARLAAELHLSCGPDGDTPPAA